MPKASRGIPRGFPATLASAGEHPGLFAPLLKGAHIMTGDFIPHPDQDFLTWAKNLGAYVASHLTAFGIDPELLTPLQVKLSAFETALIAAENPNHGKVDTFAKNEAKTGAVAAFRPFIKAYLAYNPRVSDVDRENMGLPVYSSARTPIPPPSTKPELLLDSSMIRQVIVHYKDFGSEHSGKPHGVHGVELRWALLEIPPENVEDLPHSEFDTATPYTFVFEEAQRGKTLYICPRWENNKGEKGPSYTPKRAGFWATVPEIPPAADLPFLSVGGYYHPIMTKITVDYDDKTVLAVLSRIAQSFTPAGMRGAMEEIGEELVESTRRRFDTATAPDGTPWKPLADATVLARYQEMIGRWDEMRARMAGKKSYHKKDGALNKRGQRKIQNFRVADNRPLIDTGELAGRVGQGPFWQIINGGAGVEIGVTRTFDEGRNVGAEVHQFGTRDGRIPARPFLGLSAEDKTTVLDILNELLEEAARP
jgi:phage gpG-like protein